MRFIRFQSFAVLSIFVLLSSGINQSGVAASFASSTRMDSRATFSDSVSDSTTPELIEQAYLRGEISSDERWLYMAYAVYEYQSLPERYWSNTPWWGTGIVREMKHQARRMSLDASVQNFSKSEFERLLSPQATVCDRTDAANNINSAHFHVNYGSIGGGLSIDNYTASLETTYNTEVASYGWAAPPYTVGNPWNRYPVQVASLSGGLYGYVTNSGGGYIGFIGDNLNTAATETAAYASCMVLNSDYSHFPSGALGSLQATAAHEFVHSFQFGVGDPLPWEDEIWWESIAVYMEDEVYDSVDDNYYYLWPNFNTCLGEFSGDVYANWLFFRYAAEHNGGINLAGGGEDIAQGFWTNVSSQGQTGLQAYNNALGLKGANLANTFHQYAIATRFMNSCPTASPYCYEEASGYLAEAGPIGNHGNINSAPGSYAGTVMDNYGLNWVSLPVTGPMTITLRNQSASGQLRASIVAKTASGLTVTPFPAVVGGGSTSTLVDYSPPGGATLLIAVITNQLQTANDPSSCSATAYLLSLNQGSINYSEKIYFPLIVKSASPMQGRITYRGVPVSGEQVMLRYYNGSSWSTYDTAITDANGDYSFYDHPTLSSGMHKYVRWDNTSDNDDWLWTWRCDYIDQASDSSQSLYTCDFDLEDIQLLSPAHGARVSLPRTFSWQPRWLTTDSYEFDLYDVYDEDPYWYTDPLGYVSTYVLNSLPFGFSPGVQYVWEVWVYGPNGYGVSYYYRNVTFSNTGLSLDQSQILLPRNRTLDDWSR